MFRIESNWFSMSFGWCGDQYEGVKIASYFDNLLNELIDLRIRSIFISPFLQCFIHVGSCAFKRSWQLKMSRSSSRRIAELHNCSIYAVWLVWHARIDSAQLLCCCWRCWLRHVWADQSEQTFRGWGPLKRQQLKQIVIDRWGTQSCSTG